MTDRVAAFDRFYSENKSLLRPTMSYPRNEAAIDEIVRAARSFGKWMRVLYNVVAIGLRHIAFDQFYQTLMRCAHEAVAVCQSENRQMYLFIDGGVRKSNTWCALLIWPVIRRHVVRIVNDSADLRDVNERILVVQPDDASYSGVQISSAITIGIDGDQMKWMILVAGLTERARKKITSRHRVVFPSSVIPIQSLEETALSLIGADDTRTLVDECSRDDLFQTIGMSFYATLTYFDHKLADNTSTNDTMIALAPVPVDDERLALRSLIAGCSPRDYGFAPIVARDTELAVETRCPPEFYKRIAYTLDGAPIESDERRSILTLLNDERETGE